MLAGMHSEHENDSAVEQIAADENDVADAAPALAVNDDIPELSIDDSVAGEEPLPDLPETDSESDTAAALSPSVRRLVRQYDLDITGIHGSGPAGRIKVGDVIALLGGRTDAPAARSGDAGRTIPATDDALEERGRATPYRTAQRADSAAAQLAAAAAPGVSATTLFECDLTRVLGDRKQRSEQQTDIALTSYYLVACSEALRLVPDAAPAGAALGVVSSMADGQLRTVLVELEQDSALGSIGDRLAALDRALRARDAVNDVGRAALLLHHHGPAGCLMATPTPIGAGQAASIGVGRVRKQIVVRTVNGEDVPRVAALCYVTLSFLSDRLDLQRANRFLAHFVRVLEQWPE